MDSSQQPASVVVEQPPSPPPITLTLDHTTDMPVDSIPNDNTQSPPTATDPTTQEQPHTPVQADTPAPPRPQPPDLEHPFWAEVEEDVSVPDEAEMREIESAADGDYSAYECMTPPSCSRVAMFANNYRRLLGEELPPRSR